MYLLFGLFNVLFILAYLIKTDGIRGLKSISGMDMVLLASALLMGYIGTLFIVLAIAFEYRKELKSFVPFKKEK